MQRYDVENDKYCETDHNMSKLSESVKRNVFNLNNVGDSISNINVAPRYKCYKTEFVINSGVKFRENSNFDDNQLFRDIICRAEKIMFLDECYCTHNIHSKF